MPEKLDPAKLTPETLAKLLSNAAQRLISEDQVRHLAEAGNLLHADGTVNLIHYTAFLAENVDNPKIKDESSA